MKHADKGAKPSGERQLIYGSNSMLIPNFNIDEAPHIDTETEELIQKYGGGKEENDFYLLLTAIHHSRCRPNFAISEGKIVGERAT